MSFEELSIARDSGKMMYHRVFYFDHVLSTDARGNCVKEQASSRVSWVPRAVGIGFMSGIAANGRAHRAFVSVGLFSRRKLSLGALLAGLGKAAREERRLHRDGPV